MRYYLVPLFLTSALFAGCAQFSNRLVCTADGSDSYVISQYMNVGISSKIQKSDMPEQCNRIRQQSTQK